MHLGVLACAPSSLLFFSLLEYLLTHSDDFFVSVSTCVLQPHGIILSVLPPLNGRQCKTIHTIKHTMIFY